MHDDQLRHPEHETLTNIAAIGAGAEDPTQIGFWSVGQPASNELRSTHASIQAAIDAVEATLFPDKIPEPEPSVTPADEISNIAPQAAFAEIPEIRCHQRDGVSLSAAAPDRSGRLRGWLFAGALVGAFCLGWLGGSNSYRVLDISAALNPLTQRLKSFARLLDPKNGTATNLESTARNTTYKPSPDTQSTRKVSASGTIAPDSANRPSPSVARLAAIPLSPVSPIARENIVSPGFPPAQKDEWALPRLTPTPDTRPATIEGWTVRQVYGGTAVLEGPGGVWRAMRGDTVPGVGRIDSIVLWGGRWIVASTRGLITTQ